MAEISSEELLVELENNDRVGNCTVYVACIGDRTVCKIGY